VYDLAIWVASTTPELDDIAIRLHKLLQRF